MTLIQIACLYKMYKDKYESKRTKVSINKLINNVSMNQNIKKKCFNILEMRIQSFYFD